MAHTENELLEHEIINEIESDINNNYFDALSELLSKLIEIDEAKTLLIGYLSDLFDRLFLKAEY